MTEITQNTETYFVNELVERHSDDCVGHPFFSAVQSLVKVSSPTGYAAMLYYGLFTKPITEIGHIVESDGEFKLHNFTARGDCNLKRTMKRAIKEDHSFFALKEDIFFRVFPDGVLAITLWESGCIGAAYAGTGDGQEAIAFFLENTELAPDVEPEDDKISYKLVQTGPVGFSSFTLKMDKMEVDIAKNYNDDFCYERLLELQLSNKPTLSLLHGPAGTGKTTILKKLICDIGKNRKVFYMDCNMLSSFSDSRFLSFVLDELGDNVLILEDCEKALMDRNTSVNPIITTLLNLTDGFLADTVKPHFICTFNCPLNKIDKALLRKGRLKFRYEFRELCLNKCKEINPQADRAMTLADLYNLNDSPCTQEDERKIGF